MIGGALFELGGFKLPFLVIGGLNFAVFLIAFAIFPEPQYSDKDLNRKQKTLPILPLFKSLRFLLTLLLLFAGK